ncbi:MAG: rhodanese-like domain-containing protein [Saprospiraceae bacterium]|nr:rhodanese-like domain-containing protein [Saprospiraceae bacterium]
MDIDVKELKTKLDAKETFIFIDVREPYEYEEFNLNAKLIPLGNLVAEIPSLRGSENEEIVVHCRSGQRSGIAQKVLMQSGFTNVRNLLGGVLAWQEAGY